ncbi:Cytochrome P450 monooxygenase lepH [Lachnellula arida]|uniref:Cytochrome P450 monooxygenase lepH n=1 Tax=Lachnellula arida TaxID=1316785 RepID=A0A8T9B312_9HELO|nr:Cytochrome P450 monooxygenase lepH [Lachnellula arida]
MLDFGSLAHLAAILGITTITYILYRAWEARQARRALVLQAGCKDVAYYPHEDWLWGSDLVRRRQEAIKEGGLMRLYAKQFDTYGKTWEENFTGTRLINTMDKENIQHIATRLDDFGRAYSRRNIAWPFMGNSITSSDGAEWKHARNLINPTFSRAELSDIDGLSLHVNRLIALIPGGGKTFDIQPLFQKLVVDITSEFLFGKSMDSLLPESSFDSDTFFKALDRSLAGVLHRRQAGNLGMIRYAYDPEWKHAYKVVHSYIDERVKEALQATAFSSPDQDSDGKPRKYVLLQEMAKQIRDPIQLRYQILAIFLPARELTGVLLSNALFHLARNPDIWTQLRQTALKVDPEKLTFESLKSLKDFRNVIFETFRHQGPAGRTLRMATRDTTLPRGGGKDGQSPILVRKGTHVSSNNWALNHDADIHPDPYVFKPERWVDKRQSWEFIPFSGGPRICPANQQLRTRSTKRKIWNVGDFPNLPQLRTLLPKIKTTTSTTNPERGALGLSQSKLSEPRQPESVAPNRNLSILLLTIFESFTPNTMASTNFLTPEDSLPPEGIKREYAKQNEKLALLAAEDQIQNDEKAVAAQKLLIQTLESSLEDAKEALPKHKQRLSRLKLDYGPQETNLRNRENFLQCLKTEAEKSQLRSDEVEFRKVEIECSKLKFELLEQSLEVFELDWAVRGYGMKVESETLELQKATKMLEDGKKALVKYKQHHQAAQRHWVRKWGAEEAV